MDPFLGQLDVLYLCNNAPFSSATTRKHILDFANSGKGLLLVHPALWYNWTHWPEFNQVLCGGGSRGHDRYAEFEVTVTDPDHPLMRGLPAKFTVKDELYWFEPDPQGTPIKVLAVRVEASGPGEPGAVVAVDRDGIVVACGEGTRLRLIEVQPASRKPMPASAFAAGARLAPGTRFV